MTTTKPQSTTETLEPCPNPECQSTKVAASNDFSNYYVYCPDCFLRGPRESVDHFGARWNALPRAPASTAPVVDDNGVAFAAYNQAVEDAKAAILAEANGNSLMLPGTFINAIARKCSPHVYVNRLTAAATAAPQQPRSNHFPDEALNKGFPDHISRDGTAYYSDGAVLPSAAPVEQSDAARLAAAEIAQLEKPNHTAEAVAMQDCDICNAYRQKIAAIIKHHYEEAR